MDLEGGGGGTREDNEQDKRSGDVRTPVCRQGPNAQAKRVRVEDRRAPVPDVVVTTLPMRRARHAGVGRCVHRGRRRGAFMHTRQELRGCAMDALLKPFWFVITRSASSGRAMGSWLPRGGGTAGRKAGTPVDHRADGGGLPWARAPLVCINLTMESASKPTPNPNPKTAGACPEGEGRAGGRGRGAWRVAREGVNPGRTRARGCACREHA